MNKIKNPYFDSGDVPFALSVGRGTLEFYHLFQEISSFHLLDLIGLISNYQTSKNCHRSK